MAATTSTDVSLSAFGFAHQKDPILALRSPNLFLMSSHSIVGHVLSASWLCKQHFIMVKVKNGVSTKEKDLHYQGLLKQHCKSKERKSIRLCDIVTLCVMLI